MNGVVYVCECDKEERRSATERMISTLAQGSNLMYYPEGTWNLLDHLPMLPCYWGIIQVAQAGGAAAGGSVRSRLAMDVFCYGVSKYIGAYAAMGGVDAVIFTAGIGKTV